MRRRRVIAMPSKSVRHRWNILQMWRRDLGRDEGPAAGQHHRRATRHQSQRQVDLLHGGIQWVGHGKAIDLADKHALAPLPDKRRNGAHLAAP